jgi:hypothetical protein
MVFMGYPVPAGEIKRWQGKRRDDHDDAQTKHRTKIEAKKTFAGLTRGGGHYQNPRFSRAAMDGFMPAASMRPDGGQLAYSISRAIAALEPAILGGGRLPEADRRRGPRWRHEPPRQSLR